MNPEDLTRYGVILALVFAVALALLTTVRFVWPLLPEGMGEGVEMVVEEASQVDPASLDALRWSQDRTDGTVGGEAPASMAGVTLSGVLVRKENPERSMAFVRAGGKPERRVRVGEAVVDGVILREVAFDHVWVEQGGARKRIDITVATPPSSQSPGPGGAPGMVYPPGGPTPGMSPSPLVPPAIPYGGRR